MKDKIEELEEYVLESDNYERAFKLACLHKDFLNQPLTLGMFVPCDEYNVPIPEKDIETFYNTPMMDWYEQAKERVLFENFELDEYGNLFYGLDGLISNWKDKPIEQLLHKDLDITLTKSAQKQTRL